MSPWRGPARVARLVMVKAGMPLLALATLVGWSLAFPVGSSPDDDYHLASIWCAQGTKPGVCGEEEADGTRALDRDLVITAYCYIRNANASASCQGDSLRHPGGPTVQWSRGNYAESLYPPVYYGTASFFAAENIEKSVVKIRWFNALLLVGLVTVLYWLLPPARRALAVVPLAATLVPLGLSIVASTNPSAWGIVAAATLWVAMVGYFEARGARAWALGCLAIVAAVIGAGARSDSAAYTALAIAAAWWLCAHRTRGFAVKSLLALALVGGAALLYLSGEQHAAINTGLSGPEAPTAQETVSATISRLIHFPSLIAGVFGSWPLGWFDTPLPPALWILAALPASTIVIAGLRRLRPRKAIVLGVTALTTIAGPLVVLARTHAPVGQYVQPRYVLPLVIIFVGISMYRDLPEVPRPASWIVWPSVGLLSTAHAVALHASIRRYVTGIDVSGWNLDAGREWWWEIPISPMSLWIATSIAFIALTAAIGWTLMHPRDPKMAETAPGLKALG